MAEKLDYFYGRPSKLVRKQFQDRVKAILKMKTWREFFKFVHLKVPNKNGLYKMLCDALGNSAQKRYHRPGMNFSRVQSSGVSKILLKGEQYSASPTLKHVTLQDHWGWASNQGTLFLDASCLVYGFDRRNLGYLDYSHTLLDPDRSYNCPTCNTWNKNNHICTNCGLHQTPALQHSGDVLDVQKSSGTHTIHVYLNNLGRNVQSLWFTLSGWTTTLDQIKQPYIRFTDADLDMELCRYNLGGTRDKHLYTCVIMCVLYRVTPSSNWKVKALGNVGQGRASNYNPIRMDIENLLRSGILK
eukprot:TRINITY_DN107_c0_g2_i1.p1 TRINITY_DN107_c0_g2~~TRINITY_DN107_c0_g2_i1.p1  ORF type:complete len:300 (-),score=57.68 TRINITY_DN107_c0_g2_i1:185-1084(-)